MRKIEFLSAIKKMGINPIMPYSQGAVAVDARIVLDSDTAD